MAGRIIGAMPMRRATRVAIQYTPVEQEGGGDRNGDGHGRHGGDVIEADVCAHDFGNEAACGMVSQASVGLDEPCVGNVVTLRLTVIPKLGSKSSSHLTSRNASFRWHDA
jgi:hypothetical protein